MSNELLNAYIKFGEPDGDDLDFSQIADWAGYLLQEQRERIAELVAEHDGWQSMYEQRVSDAQRDHIAAQKRIAELKDENQRLQGENESLLVERRRLEAECHRLLDALESIESRRDMIPATNDNIVWGYLQTIVDIAKQALEKET